MTGSLLRLFSSSPLRLLALFLLLSASGCGSHYMAPGAAADFRALGVTAAEQQSLTDYDIAARMARKPAANFPASIASARVQAPGYESESWRRGGASGGTGFTVITNREVEGDEDLERLAKLPQVRGLAPLNSLMLPKTVNDQKQLRLAAADAQADMLLLYTFDTKVTTNVGVPLVGLITLGMGPDRVNKVTSTCSAVLIDTRTGYLYGTAESTERDKQISSAWTEGSAIDQVRLSAEKAAFTKMIRQMETLWPTVARTYGPPPFAVR